MNHTILIPEFLGFVKLLSEEGFEFFGCVCYMPAHEHTPGGDVPCSSSWLMII